MTNRELIPLQGISEAYHPHIDQLSRSVRYWAYQGDMDDRTFIRLMGPDVVFLTHPQETARIAKKFIDYSRSQGEDISQEETSLLLTACWIHDLGELKIDGAGVGDVCSHKKGDDDVRAEKLIFLKVIEQVSDPQQKEFMIKAYDEVVMNTQSKLGKIFNTIERIGYLETTLRAFKGINDERIHYWLGLSGVTLSHQIEVLIERARDYKYVNDLLITSADDITQMFTTVLKSEKIPQDDNQEPFYKIEKIQDSYNQWLAFTQ